jgi:hypothetical protein
VSVDLSNKQHQMSGSWQTFATYTDLASAQAIAGRLELEGVPIQLETAAAMSGIEEGFKLLVPADFLHRARWVLAQSEMSTEELTFLATGRLEGGEQ